MRLSKPKAEAAPELKTIDIDVTGSPEYVNCPSVKFV